METGLVEGGKVGKKEEEKLPKTEQVRKNVKV